jgi:hypothetical protein
MNEERMKEILKLANSLASNPEFTKGRFHLCEAIVKHAYLIWDKIQDKEYEIGKSGN